ncbi:MAG: hypothetical protein ACFFCS_00330 [Candidatus Hodarchaeota archaeon]
MAHQEATRKRFDDLNLSLDTKGWILKRSGLNYVILEKSERNPTPRMVIGCRIKENDIIKESERVRHYQEDHQLGILSDLLEIKINTFEGYYWTIKSNALITTWYKLKDPTNSKHWCLTIYIERDKREIEKYENEIRSILDSINLIS